MESKKKTPSPAMLFSSETIASSIVDVEFGSPMKNCLHYGICRVTIPEASSQGHCPCRCRATISAWEDSLVQFVFDKNKMPAKTFDKYFSSGFFQVDDEYAIPLDILQKIGLEKFRVKIGLYPILMERDKLKVVF